MSNSISKQYDDELAGWKHSIEFYEETLESLGDRLAEVINRNSIVDIAAKVEVYQIIIDKVIIKLKVLEKDIEQQEKAIKEDVILIDDEMITASIKENQNLLRAKTQKTEREYIDAKHECNEFLSAILKK